jgi:hypothetical protein
MMDFDEAHAYVKECGGNAFYNGGGDEFYNGVIVLEQEQDALMWKMRYS